MKPISVFKQVFLASLLLSLLSACANNKQTGHKQINKKPNIVFILIDDMGWPDTEVYGHQFHETPNINKLAAEGLTFTNAYAASPVCSSTRGSIQTGQYPARTGITDFIPGHMRPFEKLAVPHNRTQYLPLEYITLGEAMKEAGYRTGYYGKWHLDGLKKPRRLPNLQGYDETITRVGGAHFNFGNKMMPQQPQVSENEYLADFLTDQALAFIDRNKEQPFFLTLSHYAVHIPLQAKQETIDKYEAKEKPAHGVNNAIYAAMVEHVDESVGRVETKLKELGLENDTLVVFYSDNGGLVKMFNGNGPVVSTNDPLRDEKGSLYEGGIREPFIVKYPAMIKTGGKTDSIMTSPDLFPTFVELAGGKLPQSQIMDGESLVPIFNGEDRSSRTIYFHYPHYHHSEPAGAIREGNYKLIQFYEDMSVELYDLSSDIGEKTNLAKNMPAKTKELTEKLAAWRNNIKAEMPVPNPRYTPERAHEWHKHPDHPRYKPIK